MSDFTEAIVELVKKDLASGSTLKEAVINAGFHRIDGTNTYIMGYGLYRDKALVTVIPD
jgi:hypothetical protein